jgi:serine phosphatase RsbU (regulator of sigma subunit)
MYFALLRKPKGYLIILTGMIIFSALLLYIFISIFINHSVQISTASEALLFFVCLLIIPLTMSIYLAYSFGIINQELEKKLHEVRILSEENIRKEKEKQEILRNQNLLLEEQVKERTREIELQKNIIEEKNKDIMDSINYATRIQNSILVPEKELASITGDAFVIFYPKDILSGDFYTMHRSGDSIFVFAADCTGHGVPGALMSMIGNTLIHKIIHEMQIHSPGKILEMLHQELRKNLKQDSPDSESKDGMDVAVVRIQNNIITYAGANRPLLFISKDNSLQQIRPTKTSIGGTHLSVIQVEEHAMEIKNIQRIFLFSDGFTDQFGGPDKKKISSSRLKEWIQQTIGKKGHEIKEELNRRFLEWKGQTEQTDDVLMLSIGFSS